MTILPVLGYPYEGSFSSTWYPCFTKFQYWGTLMRNCFPVLLLTFLRPCLIPYRHIYSIFPLSQRSYPWMSKYFVQMHPSSAKVCQYSTFCCKHTQKKSNDPFTVSILKTFFTINSLVWEYWEKHISSKLSKPLFVVPAWYQRKGVLKICYWYKNNMTEYYDV